MLEQVGSAITFYAHFIASKVGATGLAVTVDVYKGTGGTPIVVAGSATELGGGLYYYTLSDGSVDTAGMYVAIFKTADDTVDQQHVPAAWAIGTAGIENLDVAISSRLAAEDYTAPTDPDLLAEVVEGSYTVGDFLRLLASVLLGKAHGGGTATITFRGLGDTKNRVVATVDSNGNRTQVVLDAS